MQRRLQKLFLLGAVMTLSATANVQAEELPKITSESIGSLRLVQDAEEIFQIVNKPEDYKLKFDYWEVLNPYQESNIVNTETMYAEFLCLLVPRLRCQNSGQVLCCTVHTWFQY